MYYSKIFLVRILKINFDDYVTNVEVLRGANIQRFQNIAEGRWLRFTGNMHSKWALLEGKQRESASNLVQHIEVGPL